MGFVWGTPQCETRKWPEPYDGHTNPTKRLKSSNGSWKLVDNVATDNQPQQQQQPSTSQTGDLSPTAPESRPIAAPKPEELSPTLFLDQPTGSAECAVQLVRAYSRDERTRNVFSKVHKHHGRQVFVRTSSSRPTPMNIDPNGTVEQLKFNVQAIHGVPADQQLLTVNGEQLRNGHKLSEYNIGTDSTVHLSLRLLGGAKAGEQKKSRRRTSERATTTAPAKNKIARTNHHYRRKS